MTELPDRTASAPAPTWAGLAVPGTGLLPRRIRVLTGVTEWVLDRMPTERSRYTALACVMIGTALLGGLSMFLALSELAGSYRAWCIPLALFWSALVLCIDRWLVSSMAGLHLRSRLPAALLRLLVAMVIGFVIAEPLVLQIFHTAVESQVRTERQQNIDGLQGALLACNPTGSAPATTPPSGYDCVRLRLNVSATSNADKADIAARTNDENGIQLRIDAIDNQLSQLKKSMDDECNGVRDCPVDLRV